MVEYLRSEQLLIEQVEIHKIKKKK